ncbi:MAG: flavin reductase family protein [Syntrophomonas sp.]
MILKPQKREQVLPLPVVLISTMDKQGIANIAPWSNMTPILRPLDEIVFASWIKRDTLANVRATGEFVVNIPSNSMIEEVMICSRDYPPEVDEFVEAGLKPRPSKQVQIPGIEGCLAWIECTLIEEIARKHYSLVIGKVVHLEANDKFFNQAGEMDFERACPLSVMLGAQGMQFTRPTTSGRWADYSEMFIKKNNNKSESGVISAIG